MRFRRGMRTGSTSCCGTFSVSCLLPSAFGLASAKSVMYTPLQQWEREWKQDLVWQDPLHRLRNAHFLPVEMLSEIFLLVSQFPGNKRWNWSVLMLVCRHWRAVILSTPGLDSQLRIRRSTQKEVVRAFIQGRKMRLGVIVDMNDEGDGSHFNAENFRACFMAAIQAASRWSSLSLISPPPSGEYTGLQIVQPLTHLESLLTCSFSELLEQLMAAMSKDAFPNLTVMGLTGPTTILCLVQPARSHIYHSLTTLKIQLFKRVDNPVDILPHLHRLETLEACRLCLPSYSPDSPLPLVHTLRSLYLKSVSVQWMAGHIFPALEKCRIIFPLHADTIHAFQPVTMPSCSFLLYNSNDLHPLSQFHLPSLYTLDVKNGQWNAWRGNPQLISFCPIVAANPQTLTVLRLDIQCSGRLLGYILRLTPAVEELWLGLAHPNALSKTFFQAFIVRESHADRVSEMVGPPGQTIAPLCPSLKSLHLHYKRWMRGPDKKVLVVAFSDIVRSRRLAKKSPFSLRLSFEGAIEEPHWTIHRPVKKIKSVEERRALILGISTLHGIVTMSKLLPERGLTSLPFNKVESLHLFAGHLTSLDFLFIRDHMELMVYDHGQLRLPSSLPCALPLFDALRVLVIKCNDLSFLAGHTFHKLERCRLLNVSQPKPSASKRMLTETETPVCTRVDIDDPWVLANFMLPQIQELALGFLIPHCSSIWQSHVAVNANLAGLILLHIKTWPFYGDLILILRLLPLLETLIITTCVDVHIFRAFIPMDANGTSGLKRTNGEGKTLAILCPRLRHVQVEGEGFWEQPDLVPIVKAVITLRAECGSPLKVFTFSDFSPKPGRKFDLIGRDGSFTIKVNVLAKEAEKFKLDI